MASRAATQSPASWWRNAADALLELRLTRQLIGRILYPLVPGGPEALAGVTPTDYGYPELDVRRYGASPTASAAVNVLAFQAALNVANQRGGGKVTVPAGSFALNAKLNIYKKTKLSGAGWYATRLIFSHVGDGICSTWPINSSTGVYITLSGFSIENTNAANTGGGFVDVGGTFITLKGVSFLGWKYQVILDQSELADVHYCTFDGCLASGCAIWLVNGAEHTVGAMAQFTNRISVKYSQLNGPAGAVAIVDDGGNTHSLEDNNYNGFATHIRATGVTGLRIVGGEFETAAGTIIRFESTTYFAGAGAGPCLSVHAETPELIPINGQSCISIASLGTLKLTNPYLGNTSAAKIIGLVNCSQLIASGVTNGGGGATFSGMATVMVVDGHRIDSNIQAANYTFALPDMGGEVKNNSNAAYAYTIPPNATVPIPVGARIRVVTQGGAITLTRGAGVALYKVNTFASANVVLSTGGSLIGVATLEQIAADIWVVDGTPLT